MHTEIRSFDQSDTQAVVDLWKVVFPDDPPWNSPDDVIRIKRTQQPDLFFVYVENGQLIGTVLAGFDGVRGWVHKLAVHPGYQGKGHGLELMKAAESALAALGCPKLNLQVRSTNAQVIEFYRRAGYSVEDRTSMGKQL